MRLTSHALRVLSVSVMLTAVLLTGCSSDGGETPAPPANSERPSASSEAPAESNSSAPSESTSSSTTGPEQTEKTDGIKWTYSKNSDGTITLIGYDKNAEKVPSGELKIPEKYDGYTVSKIGNQCLYKNNDIECVIIPACVQTIGQQSFYQCKNLTSVSMAEGVRQIELSAFSGCNLDTVTLPLSLTKVGANAFAENVSLSNAVILGKTEFDSGTFNGCKNLITVEFKNSIRALPSGMFRECAKLQNIVFPTNLKTLGSYIFYKCSLLSEITIPETVTGIGSYGFAYTGLESIVIPNGVTEIGNWEFSGCKNLSSVTIPETVKIIGEGAFANCAFTRISLPKRMSQIKNVAFWNCSALRKIALPEGLTVIDTQAFEGCVSLTDIYIPASVVKVNSDAFQSCKSLSNVYFGGSEERWNQIVISESTASPGNRYLTNSIMNRYWNQTAASIGY